MANQTFVRMSHPDIEGEAETTPEAFEEVWKDKGWELVSEEPNPPAEPASRPAPARPEPPKEEE